MGRKYFGEIVSVSGTVLGTIHEKAKFVVQDEKTKERFEFEVLGSDFLDDAAKKIGSASLTRCKVEIRFISK